ncbi:MAG: glycosyltransferase [Propionibacteriaceae bacterium]|nr:glycosyltransferase [Propionibacteriaceae bacterium]
MNHDSIRLHVESIEPAEGDDAVILTGWGFDPTTKKPLEVVSVNAEPVSWHATTRNDVNAVHSLRSGVQYGLSIRVDHATIGSNLAIQVRPADTTDPVVTVKVNQRPGGHKLIGKVATAWNLARSGGVKSVARQVVRRLLKTGTYPAWIKKHEAYDLEAVERTITSFANKPLISIVTPVYNVEERYFQAFLTSIKNQYYTNWELCLADDASTEPHVRPMLLAAMATDPRIKVTFRETNGHISEATNSALDLVSGAFVAFVDNDDELAPHALYENVAAINADPGIDFLYSDEDKMTEAGKRVEPFFKPNWNRELLFGHNYITHLVVVRRDLLERTGRLRSQFNGAQDYDFVLRATAAANTIHHIPAILYHWKMLSTSTANEPEKKLYAFEAGREALTEALARRGVNAEVNIDTTYLGAYHITYPLTERPLVSVVIVNPTANQHTTWLKNLRHQSYEPVELVAASSWGQAVRQARGQYVLLANPGLRSIRKARTTNTEWLTTMVSRITEPDIGVVTGMVANLDNQVLVAGLSIDANKPRWVYDDRGRNKNTIGTYFRTWLPRYVAASTTDFTLVAREDAIEWIDDLSAKPPAGGVELTVDIRQARHTQVLFCPTAQMYATAPISDKVTAAMQRRLIAKHPDQTDLDPYINLNRM